MKLFYFISLLLLSPILAAAEVSHTRSFSESPVSALRMIVTIAADDYDKDINCGGLEFWGIQVIEHKTGNRFSGNPRFVSSAVLSQTFTIDVLPGDYEEVTFICSGNGENEAFQFGSIENDFAISIKPPSDDSAKSSSQTGIIPSIIKGISDFLGISPEAATTTTVTSSTALTAATSTDLTVATSTEENTAATSVVSTTTTTEEVATTTVTATTSPEETIILPPPGEIASSTTATTTQASRLNSLLAAIGLLSRGANNLFVAVAIAIGILLLALILYRIAQWLIVKRK